MEILLTKSEIKSSHIINTNTRNYLGYDEHFPVQFPNYKKSYHLETTLTDRSKRNRYMTRLLVELNQNIDNSKEVLVIDSDSLFQELQVIHLLTK